jgi:hypothetical protein
VTSKPTAIDGALAGVGGVTARAEPRAVGWWALQVFDLNHAVRILAFDEPRGHHREVLSVAVTARRAVYSNFKLSACHCG